MPDVLSIGELLIDFVSTETDATLSESPGFIKAPGGAPANVAVGLAKLGIDSGFIGKIGDDPFGEFLRTTLEQSSVDTQGLISGVGVRTTLAFVAARSDGQKDICFYRNPGADILLRPDELNSKAIQSAKALHYGSVSLSHRPSRDATMEAIRIAKDAGVLLSYDPNLRLSLWDDPQEAWNWIWKVMPNADVVKLADEEWEFITGTEDLDAGCDKIFEVGRPLIIVTLGKDGCYFNNGEVSGHLDGFAVDAIDTLGAGDAFVAAMLSQLLDGPAPVTLDEDALRKILRYANAAGALATQEVGVIPALPSRAQIQQFLEAR